MEATAWIALAALGFAGIQAWIAHRKLRFDLFAKRFETWDSINNALNEYRQEVETKRYLPGEIFRSEKLKTIWTLQNSMNLLFPTDVSECLQRIDAEIAEYTIAKSRLLNGRDEDEENKDGGKQRYENYLKSESNLRNQQGELMRLVHRYIRQYGWFELTGVEIRKRIARWRTTRLD